jgi:hypothetical protein
MGDHDDRNERKAPAEKRSLFAELGQAMDDVKAHGEGRLTLRAPLVHKTSIRCTAIMRCRRPARSPERRPPRAR